MNFLNRLMYIVYAIATTAVIGGMWYAGAQVFGGYGLTVGEAFRVQLVIITMLFGVFVITQSWRMTWKVIQTGVEPK